MEKLSQSNMKNSHQQWTWRTLTIKHLSPAVDMENPHSQTWKFFTIRTVTVHGELSQSNMENSPAEISHHPSGHGELSQSNMEISLQQWTWRTLTVKHGKFLTITSSLTVKYGNFSPAVSCYNQTRKLYSHEELTH
ncbi:hypothetical protein CEXT_15071 [Caerostris extrusa]|uniref:Uncharacterized protein n=1 Tax=Caerostris extrusa TaxID=172846 RepID=A0AAV4MEM9_CAEEX|nr:hypothetical protein CEXT_15071 [Caerostris extrusa]